MAQIYLSSDDSNFILANAGSRIFGQSGSESVLIRSGATDIFIDQNTERIDVQGQLSDFTFQQAGNQLRIFSGLSVVATLPVHTGGSQIVFSDGSVQLTLSAGVMSLGGATVPAGSASAVTPLTLDSSVTCNDTDPGSNHAMVFLDSGDSNFQVMNSGTQVFANAGNESTCCAANVSGIVVDQNTERIDVMGAYQDYTYQQAGNRLLLFHNGLNTVTIPVQGDSNGSQLVFTNGSVSVQLHAGVMTMGGSTVTNSPAHVTPGTIDESITAGSGNGSGANDPTQVSADTGTLDVAAALDAGSDAFIFTDNASVLNNVEISNFSSDDVIRISNAQESDYFFSNAGTDVHISFNNNGTVNMITLLGVVSSEDLVYDQASFEAAIGFDAFTA